MSAPEGLGAAGTALWEALHAPREGATLELRPDEQVLAVELCRLVDDAERIRAALGDELVAEGSAGQPVAHPLRVELHRTIARVESLVRTLGLPDEPGESASWGGRRLARARWG